MNFREQFDNESSWQRRCILIETFHLIRSNRKEWTLKDTAKHFEISMGLTSEYLTLAKAIKENKELSELSRRQALIMIRRR